MSTNYTYLDEIIGKMNSCNNFSKDIKYFVWNAMIESFFQNKFSKPMPWVGLYIALASLFCILPMVADLFHGFRNRKLWFPCKYFTLNAASLTVIAVAMKLPVDLSNSMPGWVDQTTKLGSMAFMCTMMVNLLPSLATMDNKELLTNIIALAILVITMVVNVCIQVKTGVVSGGSYTRNVRSYIWLIAIVYVGFLLILLVIYICSALTIIKSKQILQSKYQAAHETALIELRKPGRLTVEKLKQYVNNHWIMAGTSSPQFITSCSATTSASGVICVFCTALHVFIFMYTYEYLRSIGSGYKWSMTVILLIQFLGVGIGTIAPLFRCFASLSFKLSIKWIWNHIKVFKVESYWTQKLYEWKQSRIPFSVNSRTSKIVIQNIKIRIMSVCIGFQKTVVVACKMIALIPVFFVICALYYIRCWKWLKSMFSEPGIELGRKSTHLENNKELQFYVLQLQDDMEVADRTLKALSKSMTRLIQKAEKQQPHNLIR